MEQPASKDDDVIKKSDEMYAISGHDLRQLYEFLIMYKDSDNPDILWRIARAASDLRLKGLEISEDEKKNIALGAFEVAKKAVDLGGGNWACHKWFAITLDEKLTFLGTKEKISQAFVVKEHLQKARELNPNDAMTIHHIGMWCKEYSNSSFYERKLAQMLFATPPSSTFQEAIELFLLAERTKPNFSSVNQYELGSCYQKIGDLKNAAMQWQHLLVYDVVNDEDKAMVKNAREALKGIPDEYKR